VVPALVRHVAAALECEVAMLGELTGPGRARALAAVREGAMLPPSDWRIAGAPCGDLPRDGEPRLIAAGVLERYPAAAQIVDRRVQSYIGALLRDADGRPIGLFSAYGFKPMQRTPRIEALFSIFAARAQSELRELRAERELRRMNEALEARVRERTADLESFTHSVAHDLRAPLRALSGLSSILQEDYAPALPPEVARYLTRIDVNARQMGRLVDDLLEFSRLGLVALKHGEVDMAALVETKVLELRSQGAERVRFEIGDILPASGDRQLLGLVWSNLLDNAVKYSRHSAAPRVDVWSERCSAGLRYVVRDNGAGFDPRFAAKLFQVFERLHSASEFEGTGVGLAIVNRVVGRHGGSVAASGTPGGGATFSFVLPQALGAALPSAA
jgi:signal transduction histidine kinase